MNHEFDVLIAGGGLVGGSLALALAESALKVGLVEVQSEKDKSLSPAGQRALALSRNTVQNLRALSVWEQVESIAMPIRDIHVSDRGHFGKTRLSARDKGVDELGAVVVAKPLEAAIDASLSRSGVHVLSEARVMGLKAGPNQVVATVKQKDHNLVLSAKLVVAADGANSTIRNLLQIGQTTRDYGQTAIIAEVTTSKNHNGTAFERFTSAGPLAVLPLGIKKCSVVWTQTTEQAETLLQLSDREFTEALQEAFGYWLGTLKLATKPLGIPLKLICAERMTDDRVVLIGNAMHQIHPVAGQGFNLGLRDAALLAERLKIQAQFGEDLGDRRFLEHYANTRKSDLDKVIRFTDSLVRVFSNDSVPLSMARNLAMFVLDRIPPAKKLLAQHAMGYGERI